MSTPNLPNRGSVDELVRIIRGLVIESEASVRAGPGGCQERPNDETKSKQPGPHAKRLLTR
jgi:hypothetical protein